MDNTTIFDDQFLSELRERRRQMMPLRLRIYTWVVVAFSAFLFLFTLAVLEDYLIEEKMSWADTWEDCWMLLMDSMVGLFVVAGAILLWMEVAWALIFNWIMMGVFLTLVIWVVALAEVDAVIVFELTLPILIIPYWIMLFPLRKKWKLGITKTSTRV